MKRSILYKQRGWFFILFSLIGILGGGCDADSIQKSGEVKKGFPHSAVDSLPTYYEKYKGKIPFEKKQQDSLYQGEFSILEAGPKGILKEKSGQNFFYIVFSRPVVKESFIGKELKHLPFLSLTPPVEGNFCWIGTNCLIFEPKASLFRDGNYQVKIKGSLKDLKGVALGEDYSFSFNPHPFQISDFWSGSADSILNNFLRKRKGIALKELKHLYIETLYPLPENQLKTLLEIKQEVNSIPFGLKAVKSSAKNGGQAIYHIKLKKSVSEGAKLQLFFDHHPMEGRNLLVYENFKVVKSYLDYDYSRLFYYPDRPPIQYLNIELTAPVKKESLKNRIFINEQAIPLDLLECQENHLLYRGVLNHSGEVNRLSIKAGVVDCYNRTMAKPYVENLAANPFDSYLFSPYQKMNFIPFDSPFLELEGWNFPRGKWEIYKDKEKIDKADFVLPFEFKASGYPYVAKNSLKELLDREQLFSFYAKISDDNQGKHEIERNQKNPHGKQIKTGQMGELSFFQITQSGITIALSKEDFFVHLVTLDGGNPIENSEVTLIHDGKECSLITNEAGWGLLHSPFDLKNLKENNFLVKINREGENLLFPIEPQNHEAEALTVGGSPYRCRAFLTSDRKSFQKGETINLLVMDPFATKEGNIDSFVTSIERVFPNPRHFKQHHHRFDSKGLFSFDYPIPQEIASGQYLLHYKTAQTIASFSFEVEEVSPRSILQLDRSDYICSQRIQATLSAKTLEGTPAINSENRLFIKQNFFPFPKERIPFKEGFVGPLANQLESRTFFHQLYSDSEGKSYFLLDSLEFYRENVLRLPSQLELTPSLVGKREEFAGASKALNLYPSHFFIAARLLQGKDCNAVEANKKFYLEYQLIRPDGELLNTPFNRKKISLEISPLGKEGERLGMTGTLHKGGFASKGKWRLKIYKAGRYLITLRSEDQLGNPVLTELPLFVLGENSQSDYIQMTSLSSSKKAGEEARLWLNLPKSLKMEKGQSLLLLKSNNQIQEPLFFDAAIGSQLLTIPITKEDYPSVRFSLIAYPKTDQNVKDKNNIPFIYSTILASCTTEVETPSVFSPLLELDEIENNVAGQVGSLKIKTGVSLNEKEEGLFFVAFFPKDEWIGKESLFSDYFHTVGNLPAYNLTFYDSRSHMAHSQIEKSGMKRWHYWDDSFYPFPYNQANERLFFPLQSNQTQTLSLSFPKEAGDYQLFLCGVWESIPFYKTFPLSILDTGGPEWEVHFPKKLTERDFVLGEIKMPAGSSSQKPIELSVQLLSDEKKDEQENQPEQEGITFSQNKLMLSKNLHRKSNLGLTAKKAGKYRIRFRSSEESNEKILDFPIEVVASHNRQTVEWNQKEDFALDLEPLAKELHRKKLFSPSLSIEFSSLPKMNWHFIHSSLMDDLEGELLDSRISALFPYFQVKGFFPYNKGLKRLLPAETQQILDLLVSLQNSNGGYPVCIDKNYESDFYTTLRVADFLEFSGLSYYEYTVVWALTQYMKLVFKGNHKDRYSYYLRCYAAWIIARYGENIVLNGKNLIEEDQGSLAEISLAAMAVLQSGKTHHIDVSDYLEQPLSRILRLYDPDLKAANLSNERDTFIAYQEKNKKGAFGYDRPRNGAVEDALVFLFLEQLGSHKREAKYAVEKMMQRDLSNLNHLDASFVMRAFYLAHKKGYLKELYPDLENQKGSFQIALGEESFFSGEFEGFSTFTQVLDSSLLSHVKRKPIYSLQVDPDGSSALTAKLHFEIPRELSCERRAGYSLLEKWQDLSGNEIEKSQFKVDNFYQYRLFLSSECGKTPFQLFIPFPSEIFYLESIITLSGDIYQERSVKKEESEEGILLNYWDFPRQFDEIVITFKPRYAGIFPKASTTIQNYFDNRLQASSGGSLIVVKE